MATSWQTIAGAEKERLLVVATPEKHRKSNFRIINRAIFLSSKNSMLSCFLAFEQYSVNAIFALEDHNICVFMMSFL